MSIQIYGYFNCKLLSGINIFMANENNTYYEATKNRVVAGYKSSALLIYGPLYLSYALLSSDNKNTGGYLRLLGSAFKVMGVLSLPGTALLTCFTAPVGVVGIAGTTAYGAIGVPVALAMDAKPKAENGNAIDVSLVNSHFTAGSTKDIHATIGVPSSTMNAQNEQRQVSQNDNNGYLPVTSRNVLQKDDYIDASAGEIEQSSSYKIN